MSGAKIAEILVIKKSHDIIKIILDEEF